MGGSDKKLLMMKLVRLFMNKKFDNFKKIFLLNKNHLKKTYILKTLKNMPNTKVLKHKIKNFHKNIIDSDLSISPAGITMLELMALNSNNLIIPQNKTQKKIANILKKASAINFANNISTINFKIILNLINKKKKNIKIINKMGKKIVFKEIISQLKNFYA